MECTQSFREIVSIRNLVVMNIHRKFINALNVYVRGAEIHLIIFFFILYSLGFFYLWSLCILRLPFVEVAATSAHIDGHGNSD